MNAERINPEPARPETYASQPEAKGAFRMPLPAESVDARPASGERKKRNRKKRKKDLNTLSATAGVTQHTDDAAVLKETRKLSTDGGEFTFWERPSNPKEQASAKFGEKVVGLANRELPVTVEPAPMAGTFDKAEGLNEATMIKQLADTEATPLEPSEAQAGLLGKTEKTEKPKTPQPAPFEWHPQMAYQQSAPQEATPLGHDAEAPHQEAIAPMAELRQEHPVAQPAETQPISQADVTAESQVESRRPNPFEQSYEDARPQSIDEISYRRRFWMETDNPTDPVYEAANTNLPSLHPYEEVPRPSSAYRTEAPVTSPAPKAKYESPIPPGYQRTPADVSRAAWTGAIAGWWLGRRGKRKAVEQARKAGHAQGVASLKKNRYTQSEPSPRLQAEPLHSYPLPEAGRRTVEPLAVSTHAPERPRPVEALASVAVLERGINRGKERQEIPATIRAAAAKAAEAVVIRPSETAPMSPAVGKVERQLGKRELMSVAKDIKVDGISLKELYKANKIDEDGLREVVRTHLRGGDVRQQLAKEVVIKEKSYELDPVLRQQYMHGERERETSPSKSSHNRESRTGNVSQTLGAVGGVLGSAAAGTGSVARSAKQAISKGAKTAQRDLIDNSNTTDWLSITAVVVLYSIILILLLT